MNDPLKSSQKLLFSDISNENEKGTLAWNELRKR